MSRKKERDRYHKALVDGYGRFFKDGEPSYSDVSSVGSCRPWWKLQADVDSYIRDTLCRHMHAGGPEMQRELHALLWEWRWLEWRLRCGGYPGAAYRADCHVTGWPVVWRLAAAVDHAVSGAIMRGVSPVKRVAYELSERLRVTQGEPEAGLSQRLRQDAYLFRGYPSIESSWQPSYAAGGQTPPRSCR